MDIDMPDQASSAEAEYHCSYCEFFSVLEYGWLKEKKLVILMKF